MASPAGSTDRIHDDGRTTDGGQIHYDGRVFRSTAAETASHSGTPTGYYHQQGDLVWAEFAGGKVRVGRLTGRCAADGTLRLAYTQVLTDGRVVAGECVSTPEVLPDGRLRLREEWQRFDETSSAGISYIEEVAAS
ncbi:MAG TPA: hypothetical protein VFB84_15130 [Micromonosporaceae bacterium]|nr:hypothetical protein [Micromonosporaceae bacterium]